MSIHENLNPTRTELKSVTDRKNLTQKGHSLLKEKNDALISELSQSIKDIKEKKMQLRVSLESSYKSLDTAVEHLGFVNTKYLAYSSKPAKKIDVSDRKIMGVKLKKIAFEAFERNFVERGYNIHDSNLSLDNAALSFEKAMPLVLETGERTHNAEILSDEIKKTNRKVNMLETVIIPRLIKDIKSISNKIDDREREEFTRIKKVKSWVSG